MLLTLEILWSIVLLVAGLLAAYFFGRWYVVWIRDGGLTREVPVPRSDLWKVLVISLFFWPRTFFRLISFFVGKSDAKFEQQQQDQIAEDLHIDLERMRRMQDEQNARKK